MNTARHHADWLSLVENTGPFLSLDVLTRVFPHGLEPRDPETARQLREAYDVWRDHPEAPGAHRLWIVHVLRSLLGYPDTLLTEGQSLPPGLEAAIPEHGETLRPQFALKRPDAPDAKPALLICVYPEGQALEKPVAEKHWKASPATRAMELLHVADVPLGLVTNGEQWMLVYAPRGETTGYASWYASLWLDEAITLRAFHSLLGVRRLVGVAEPETLGGLFAESAKNQQEVTDQLGKQVREAVEVLVQSIDALDKALGGTLLEDVSPARLYDAALTVMMRLVFLFSAEERGLLHLGKPLYDENYAVSTLLEQLQEIADRNGEEILERRFDAWARLLATFRAVHGGIHHQDLLLPAYGGSLFDPDRYPFLEGRAEGTDWLHTPAQPLEIDNRVVLHLLAALQRLQVRAPGGGPAESRRISFSGLGVEQIGHVYEGLLDHTALRAEEPVLGIGGTVKKEPEIPISELETHAARGEDTLIKFLKGETGRSPKALAKSLAGGTLLDEHKLLIACGHDAALLERVRPFAGLIREDTFGRTLVIRPGSVYVTAGTDRRDSGTQYTPPSFTEPVVRHALEPLVYEGPAEGRPREAWTLRSAAEILALKVCDPAMGSGAFLVQTVRYLADRLMEAWENAEAKAPAAAPNAGAPALSAVMENVLARPSSQKMQDRLRPQDGAAPSATQTAAIPPRPRITPEGRPATGAPGETLVPPDPDERRIYARRIVADRCIFGVDINPMAVEMAKLSLWLVTVDKARAFTFVDHALKSGDSLLGLWDRRQVQKFHLDPDAHAQAGSWSEHLDGVLAYAMAKRREIESFTVRDIVDAEQKAALLEEADAAMGAVKLLCDQLVAAALATADGNAERRGAMTARGFEGHRHRIFDALTAANSREEIVSAFEAVHAIAGEGRALLEAGNPKPDNPRRPFHWPLEFPEVFAGGAPGFDAFVGNPPFMGGQKITGVLGTDFRSYCVDALAGGKKGSADLCAYFFLRAGALLRPGGVFALIATNTIAQGDTREVGLDRLAAQGAIFRGVASRKWPGDANLEVAQVWWRKGLWQGELVLEDKPVLGITPYLAAPGKVTGAPYKLRANENLAFKGNVVLGPGFWMTPEEAAALIEKDRRNKDVLFPYLNGEDLNSRPDQSPSRWVINFHDWPLDRFAEGSWGAEQAKAEEGSKAAANRIKAWLREGRVPADYPDPVAADYPDCLAIVEEKVKPEREKKKGRNKIATRRGELWWRFGGASLELNSVVRKKDKLFVVTQTSKFHSFVLIPTSVVVDQKLVAFAIDQFHYFAVLQSSIHMEWVLQYGGKHVTRPVYTPSDCFDTFPFPDEFSLNTSGSVHDLCWIGEKYYKMRNEIIKARTESFRKIYNRFNDPRVRDEEIELLRACHIEMNRAVLNAYNWTDIRLQHEFIEAPSGTRFTIGSIARREVLDRLLALNHARYAEELAASLHEKGKKGKAKMASKPKKEAHAESSLGMLPGLELDPGDAWYFAYGSNMLRDQKQERTGTIREARKARLENFRLVFNKPSSKNSGEVFANIAPSSGGEVWGIAYRCDESAVQTMDGYEGGYERKPVKVCDSEGCAFEAVTYMARKPLDKEQPPSEEYLEKLIRGAEEHGLPADYIEGLRRRRLSEEA